MAGVKPADVTVTPLPPKDALAYWRTKIPMKAREFYDLELEARSRAFTVSGVSREDLLDELCGSMCKALEEGQSFGSWKKDTQGVWDSLGWTEKGRSFRLDNIFRTNLQTAYHVGRYAQMQRVKESRPYWQYDAVNDRRTRPTHRAMDGKVYPADHPFWDTWYPPNGFRCRCGVRTLSARQVEREGLTVETEDITGMLIEPIDPVTGNKTIARPLMPDPGFSTHPAKDWLSTLTPSELEDGEIRDLFRGALCKDGKGVLQFASESCRPLLSGIDARHLLPVAEGDIMASGLKDEQYVLAFLKEFGISKLDGTRIHKLPDGTPVVIGKGFFVGKSTRDWKVKKSGRERYVKLLARTILNPYEVWRVPAEVSGRPMAVLRLIRLFSFRNHEIGGFAVFNLLKGKVWHAATVFTPKTGNESGMLEYLERQRAGILLYREE